MSKGKLIIYSYKIFVLLTNDINPYSAISFRKQRSFHSQHSCVDETLPSHEVKNTVHFLHAANSHQTSDNDVLSTLLQSQHLLLKNVKNQFSVLYEVLYSRIFNKMI